MNISKEMIKAVVILPGTALVYVPGVILWQAGYELAGWDEPRLWLALALAVPSVLLARWTMLLFVEIGKGTPAPWAPPARLVVKGPYRYVRNPMITAVLGMLAAEALYFASLPVAGWLVVFFILNSLYFPLSEEKGLEQRFGDDYRTYAANVPRWLPRLTGWDLPMGTSGDLPTVAARDLPTGASGEDEKPPNAS